MWRLVISRLMVVTLFMMSLEGAIDSAFAADNPVTGDAYSNKIDSGSGKHTADESQSSGEQNGDHCEHCCHGHTSCISAVVTIPPFNEMAAPLLPRDVQFQYFALAPPTPPPNA